MRRWRRRQCRRRTCRRRARRRPRLAGEAARAGRHRRRRVMSCDSCTVATSRFQQKIFSLQPLTHFPRNTHDSRTKKAVTRQSFRSRPSPSPRALHYTREFQYKPKITKDRDTNRTAAMVRADYTARAELHIRSNAASRSLTQTHTQHTTRPKRKKRDAKQNCSAAQCTPPTPAPVMSALAAHRMALDA